MPNERLKSITLAGALFGLWACGGDDATESAMADLEQACDRFCGAPGQLDCLTATVVAKCKDECLSEAMAMSNDCSRKLTAALSCTADENPLICDAGEPARRLSADKCVDEAREYRACTSKDGVAITGCNSIAYDGCTFSNLGCEPGILSFNVTQQTQQCTGSFSVTCSGGCVDSATPR